MEYTRSAEYHDWKTYPAEISTLLSASTTAAAWDIGIVSDRKQRGSAINTAILGWSNALNLAVVQVRQCIFHPRRFNEVRKNYFLIGFTEQGTAFAHPVDSPLRSATCRNGTPADVVDYVLAKIWGVKIAELPDIIRQGDVALIPIRALPANAAPIEGNTATLRDTHIIKADKILQEGEALYTCGAVSLRHSKRQHAPVRRTAGLYRVQAGFRAQPWDFSLAVGD